jgi:phosphotransferase family enzyme
MGPTPKPVRCESLEQLTDPDFLGSILGPLRELRREPMGTPGYSGSQHVRFHAELEDGDRVSLVLKRTRLSEDWTAYRSDDERGREALLIASPELARVWEIFASPYVAYTERGGEIGLLMHDLAPYLLPDVREPVTLETEDALLARLASLHAAYWGTPLPSWLARPAHACSIVGTVVLGNDPRRSLPPHMADRVAEGWREALRRVPAGAATTLRRSAAEHERALAHLPRTLLHGDGKVANFAFLPGGRIAAFDWALVSAAPISLELGWYLAVNAPRLARTKEEVLERYRGLLEDARGVALEQPLWRELVSAVHLVGAAMLLWSKALALRDGRPGAREEWEWWVERIPA